MQENKLKKPRRLDPAFSARVIDELGGISDALAWLYREIER